MPLRGRCDPHWDQCSSEAPMPAADMTRPTRAEPKVMTTPIQKSVQFGTGISAMPPRVMPTRQRRTAVQAAGDDPCMAHSLLGGISPFVERLPDGCRVVGVREIGRRNRG